MGEFPNKETQFKEGHEKIGGRKKGTTNFKTLIERVFNEEIKDDNGDLVVKGLLIVKAMFDKAEKGDVSAFKALGDRLEGQPRQEMDTNVKGRTLIINRPPPRKRKTKSKA